MRVSIGSTIGPYKVERALGRGGMGEVYLAHDSRLGRRIALKALPAEVSDDPDRLSRFQREAKVLASLNHPGIGAIYGLEESDGHQYLILEFVEGETLADKLMLGALPIEDALTLAKQIAEALESAHEKGVIHRDIKPTNVMLTADGNAKVLDFGLARIGEDSPEWGSGYLEPHEPTVLASGRPKSPTIPGVILGSPGYMSPEQARGQAVDKRSDIFAFGSVLYEMLTGVQAFPGQTLTDSLGAILHIEPDWSQLPSRTPPRIRELIASALTKDRKQRLRDIGDARLILDRAIRGREWELDASGQSFAEPSHPFLRALPWTLAAAFLVIAAGLSWRLWSTIGQGRDRSPISTGPIRLRVDAAEAPPISIFDAGSLAVSDDGVQVAYVSQKQEGEQSCVALRRMDDTRLQRLTLPRREDDHESRILDIMLSPDGRLIAGFYKSSLFLIPAGGGEPTMLHEGPQSVATKGGAWSSNGIIFCPAPNAGLMIMSDKGGEPQALTVPDASRNELSHRWPDVLPGGRQALMTVKKSGILTFDDAEIALLDLGTKTWKTIIRGGSYARYLPSGHIVFARSGSIMAVPYDVGAGKITGTPVAVVPGVMTSPGSGAAQFAIARGSGTLVYMPGGVDELRRDLVWVDPDGKIEPVGAPVMSYNDARIASDGSRIAASVFGASDAVFVYDLTRRTNTRVTFRGNSSRPVWMPGSSKLAYTTDADGPLVTNLISADGSSDPEKICDARGSELGCIAMNDGKPGIVFTDVGDIWFQTFHSGSAQKLVGSQFDETAPRVSPDGRWLSYASNESGQYEVYVRPFPLATAKPSGVAGSGDSRWQVSVGGGRRHSWAPEGDAIFYCRDADLGVLRASFQTTPRVEVGQPQLMFTLPTGVGIVDALPGDKRFLAIRELPPKFKADQVNVVLNWFDELKTKVPVGSR